MKAGIVVLSATAAFWAAIALAAMSVAPWAYPGALAVALLPLLLLATRRAPQRTGEEARRIRRVVLVCTLFEAAVVGVGTGSAALAGRPDLVICLFAAGVGLHFFPLARWMPKRRYHLTGLAMLAAAGAGLAFPGPYRDALVASATSAILWATALSLVFSLPRLAARPG